MRRNLDICVLSDLHLGTHGCRAPELLDYLNSIEPARLILNGDIIDAWQFRKKYFPTTHWEVIERILQMANTGTIVYYLTGNHDGIFRRLDSIDMGNIRLRNQLELRIQGKTIWFFHGDIFDASVLIAPWLAKLGGRGYDWLIRMNALINRWRTSVGLEKISFAHHVKKSVKHAVRYITDFEKSAVEIALKKGVDTVICGHIHHPCIRLATDDCKVNYMNSGDWVENLSALEYRSGQWRIYKHGSFQKEPALDEFLSHLEDDQYIFPSSAHKEENDLSLI